MNTINISLPSQLKSQADDMIQAGYFASFSDLVRTALRNLLSKNQYDILAEEAKLEHASGQARVLKSNKDIKSYIQSISESVND